MSKGLGGQYILPPIKQHPSPNQSSRQGNKIIGIVQHDTEGGYAGAIQTLCDPARQASAHIVLREDGNEVTQLVPWGQKAWHAMAANWHFIGNEMAGFLDKEGSDQWHSAARICAAQCKYFDIPPVWNLHHTGAFGPGIVRHKDLGIAGGGHRDPVTSDEKWIWFIYLVQHEFQRGDFLPHWGIT